MNSFWPVPEASTIRMREQDIKNRRTIYTNKAMYERDMRLQKKTGLLIKTWGAETPTDQELHKKTKSVVVGRVR